MGVDLLLGRLDHVRRAGPGRWMARCSAHNDRAPSLSVRELEDGRVLVHCFGGCGVHEVLAAVGLSMADLHPRPLAHFGKPQARPWIPADAFTLARAEIAVAAVIAADMHASRAISEGDCKRLYLVVQRLHQIAEAAYGRA